MGTQVATAKKELIKHVNAIHSAAPLTLLQRKINNALLFHAYPMLTKQEEHTITITELCRMISYEGHNYDVLKEAILGLLNTVIQWNIIGDTADEQVWRAGAIISFVEIKASTCTYYYAKPLRELLYEPTVYGRISMIVQSSFASTYALALYENCVRYIGIRYTKWFDYAIFRKLMGVMDDSKYRAFKDFKKRVIDKAIAEVNLRSNLMISPEYRRLGRKVVAIRFALEEKTKKLPLGKKTSKSYDELAQVERRIVDQLRQIGLSSSHAIKLLRDYGTQYIAEKIGILQQSKAYQSGKIQSPGYLITLLNNDAQAPKILDKVSSIIDERQQSASQLANKQVDEAAKQRQAAYRAVVAQYQGYFDNLTQVEQQKLLASFAEHLAQQAQKFMLQEYHKHGLQSALVHNNFISFLKDRSFAL